MRTYSPSAPSLTHVMRSVTILNENDTMRDATHVLFSDMMCARGAFHREASSELESIEKASSEGMLRGSSGADMLNSPRAA